MHKTGALNLIDMYDVKLKYFYMNHEFDVNFTSHLCTKLMYNGLVYFFIVLCCN